MNKFIDFKETYKNENRIIYLLMFLPSFLFQKSLNNDAWFILNHGRYVINYGIPYIEPFTIHRNLEFVMQQWLSSAIFWILYNNFNECGLYLAIFISYMISIFIMFKLTRLISDNNIFISYALTLIFGVFIKFFMETRPMIFTILLVLVEFYTLELYIKLNNWRYLIALPIVSLLLINLHAAMWPILFIMILPYLIDSYKINYRIIKGQGYEKKYIFIVIMLMIVIAFINPYGLKAMTYLFTSYGHPEISAMVSEMKSPSINSIFGMIIYFFISAIIFIYLYYKKGKIRLRYLLLTLGTLIMLLSSIRNFSFFIVCSVFPLAYYLKELSIHSRNNNYQNKLRKFLVIAIIFITFLAFIVDVYNVSDDLFNDLNEAVSYILNNGNINNIILYTGYNDGGFTEFKGIRSYLDPRAEVFVKKNNKKDDIMKEYIDLQKGCIYYKEFLDKYKFTHLLVSNVDILYAYLPHDSDYVMSYENESYKIFVRNK